ncbi:MAG: hypothetical protein KY451_14830 [Actinobacteria bacterium]|nr:hypothetical protein [Actinomycetota bacterium]MBW3647653.1 hypothetical protein [Actinomycetota bacterium]
MSPLDDELRAALRGRASVLTPAPDPLAGIERRAKRIRRNRVAASVAGSALAVAAIALAVPALAPSALPDQLPPPVATPGPTVAPSPAPSPAQQVNPYALDPADPWPYRGDPEVRTQGDLDAYTVEFAARRGVLTDDVRLTPLFGQVYEPSVPELFYVATVTSSGDSWWGVVQASESGPELLVDVPLPDGTTALPAALPGDEVARLLVVAAPSVGRIEYGPDDASGWTAMTSIADGVAITPLEGDPAADQVRMLGPDGQVVFSGLAPDADAPEPATTGDPDNVLGWPVRGVADAALEERAARGFAQAKGVARAEVSFSVLVTGNNDPGQRYTVLQAWVTGQPAQVFGWVESPGRDPEPQLRPVTEPGTAAVAILLTEIPGRTTDELVVVPRPGTGEVLYKTSATAQGRPVTVDGLDGVALVDRELGAEGDSIVLLDGDGKQTFERPVSDLLCGETGCS